MFLRGEEGHCRTYVPESTVAETIERGPRSRWQDDLGILGLYWEIGKENGNYYLNVQRVWLEDTGGLRILLFELDSLYVDLLCNQPVRNATGALSDIKVEMPDIASNNSTG